MLSEKSKNLNSTDNDFDIKFKDLNKDFKLNNLDKSISAYSDRIFIEKIDVEYPKFKKFKSLIVQVDLKNEDKCILGRVISIGDKVSDIKKMITYIVISGV